MMKTLLQYSLEMLVCSGILLAAYAILLEGRVKFRWCRLYLLLSTATAALIPLLRIPVWPGEVIVATPVVTMPDLPEWNAEIVPEQSPAVTPEHLCLTVYLLGAALIVGVMLWQVFGIMRLRRGANTTRAGRYRLVRTPKEIASFSFFGTIYVWDKTPDEEMKAVIAHESSHIAHRHSVERILMEVLKAALWWNPFVWIAARRLTEAEEFEADSDVLGSGYDRAVYMQTIFKQLFGYSPEIANGLRNSLTKKRFKMMTTQTKSRHNLLRLAGTLPALIGLLCAFSFTTRAAVIVAPASAPAMAAAPATDSGIAAAAETETAPAAAEAAKEKECKVTLTVRDNDKQAVMGAIVQLSGTPKGVVTNAGGNAEITVPQGSRLEVSYPDCETAVVEVRKTGTMHAEVALKPEAAGKAANDAAEVKIRIITYKDGAPLTGAIVQVADTPRGVVTDEAGSAKLTVPKGSTLEVSYVGCKTQTVRADTPDQIILLPMDTDPAATTELSNQKALYIVDGLEVDKEFINTINPNRIESISVLKDKASLALYGEKGRDGVVVITLKGFKKPEQGASNPDAASSSITIKDGTITQTTTYPAAGRQETDGPADPDTPFLISEVMPAFPVGDASPEQEYGDLQAFRAWVQQRVKYPVEAFEKGIGGRVVLTFVIEKDGSVSTVRQLQSPDESLWQEARRVIASSPRWKPGEQRGEKVRVKYTLPVDFQITKPETASEAGNPDEEPFLRVETMPQFAGGGLDKFREWVQMRVKYPAEALEKNAYGMVVISFVVEKDGSVSTLRTHQSPDKSLADEVSRVIRSAPKWTPGAQRGQAVRVRFTLPVSFAVSIKGGTLREDTSGQPKGSLEEVVVVGYGTQK